jgi:hypothetical protein
MTLLTNFVEVAWHTLAHGFCRHLPLLALCTLIVLMVAGRVGRGYGVPMLIWDARPWRRFFSGFAVTLFFAKLFVVGFILDADWRRPMTTVGGVAEDAGQEQHQFRVPRTFHLFPSHPEAPTVEPSREQSEDEANGLMNYLFDMGLLLLLVFLILRLFGPFQVSTIPAPGPRRWPTFFLGVLAAAALVVILAYFIVYLVELPFVRPLQDGITALGIALGQRRSYIAPEAWVHAGEVFFTFALLLAYFFYSLDRQARYVNPVLTLCTVLALFANLYGICYFWIWTSPVLQHWSVTTAMVVLLIAVVSLAGWSRYKFRFRHINGVDYSQPVPLPNAATVRSPLSLEHAREGSGVRGEAGTATPSLTRIDRQLLSEALPAAPPRTREAAPPDARSTRKAKPPLVVLCVSGGASRSAVWVALMLRELNRHLPGVLHRIRLITGASGGMVGAAYHVASLQKPLNWPDPPTTCTFATPKGRILNEAEMVRSLADDALSPVIHRMLFDDLWGLIWPWPLSTDRGQGLETGWHNQLQGVLDQPLQDLARGEREGWRPTLVFSPMLVEDGRRLLVSNEPLAYLTETRWPSLDHVLPPHAAEEIQESYSTPAVEFRKLFPSADQFRISTAVRMSASFSYISPAPLLPTVPRRRVVDAGYFDDYGIDLATSWLFHHAVALKEQYGKVVLIQVRDGLDEDARESPAAPADTSTALRRGMEEGLSPVSAALTARTSGMAYRNDRQLQVLTGLLTLLYGPDFFTTVLFENSAPVSMSWYVAPEEREALDRAATEPTGDVQQRMRALRAWLSDEMAGEPAESTAGLGPKPVN